MNCYLLRRDPLTVIDTGPQTNEALIALRAGLAAFDLRLNDIQQVLITHHHVDHAGLASTLQRELRTWATT